MEGRKEKKGKRPQRRKDLPANVSNRFCSCQVGQYSSSFFNYNTLWSPVKHPVNPFAPADMLSRFMVFGSDSANEIFNQVGAPGE